MDWAQWLLLAALAAGMFFVHRAGAGGCCGGQAHGRHTGFRNPGEDRDRRDGAKPSGGDGEAETPVGGAAPTPREGVRHPDH